MGTGQYLCPGCSGSLSVAPVEGLRQYVCASCGGSVLTIPALRRLAPSVAQQIWNEGPVASSLAGPARCPFCSREMRAETVPAGTAALCRPCEAVWLSKDATEAIHIKPPAPGDEPTLASETLRCPQCGAPVANSWDETCTYCGAGLHAPVKVVLMPEEGPGDWPATGRPGEGITSLVGGVLGAILGDR